MTHCQSLSEIQLFFFFVFLKGCAVIQMTIIKLHFVLLQLNGAQLPCCCVYWSLSFWMLMPLGTGGSFHFANSRFWTCKASVDVCSSSSIMSYQIKRFFLRDRSKACNVSILLIQQIAMIKEWEWFFCRPGYCRFCPSNNANHNSVLNRNKKLKVVRQKKSSRPSVWWDIQRVITSSVQVCRDPL